MDSKTPQKIATASEASQQARLIELIRELSYREGDFTLASGKKSSFYIDVKLTALHPEGAALIGELGFLALDRWLKSKFQDATQDFRGVGGLTLGADPIGTSISLSAFRHSRHWPAFIVRKESKGHGTNKYVEGIENIAKGAKGGAGAPSAAVAPVAIVEDTLTTGGSCLKAVERARAEGLDPRVVITVVDREEGGHEAVQAAGLELISLIKLSQLRSRA